MLGFLSDGEGEPTWLDQRALHHRALQVATALSTLVEKGSKVVLVMSPGLDFSTAFLGTLYAGMVAVPAHPPDPSRLERTLPRFTRIVQHSEAKVVVGDATLVAAGRILLHQVPALAGCRLLAMPDVDTLADPNALSLPSPDDIAFLQYTSGSTRQPRGVVIRHRNIMANLGVIDGHVEIRPHEMVGIWLPPSHDMGLMVGLYSLVMGVPFLTMSPMAFIGRPRRWLEMVSKYRIAYSGGPNFGYELCLRKAAVDGEPQLDLSAWRVAFNGSEPIKLETLRRFEATFSSCGFQQSVAWMPCYGLAEVTVAAVGRRWDQPLVTGRFSRVATEEGELRPPKGEDGVVDLVGCGALANLVSCDLRIVRPGDCIQCDEGEIGEICLRGPSVADGYHKEPRLTAAT
ncbi:MAG: AMP-binding protein, partial [Proteobacteria bacterium]|nr:AMP-binding protein [Pseudomonadota bacterium]